MFVLASPIFWVLVCFVAVFVWVLWDRWWPSGHYDVVKSDPKPLTKEAWLNAFRTEAGRLRELYMSKLVAVVALQEWVKHKDEDPEKVAQAWAARQGPESAKL
jgi:hypothetical protein